MPRHADPVQRRREVATALLAVVSAEGLEAASIPRVARELGATTGLVQTYFRSKDELLRFAATHLGDLVRERVAAAAATGTMRERLLAGLSVLASAHEAEDDSEGRAWLAFLARAAVNPDLHEVHVAGAEEIRTRLAAGLAVAKEQGEVRADLDVDLAAAALAALVDGLAVQRALEPARFTRQLVRRLLDDYLGQFFT